jgi:hypothetical protein
MVSRKDMQKPQNCIRCGALFDDLKEQMWCDRCNAVVTEELKEIGEGG